jgi:hypothetical protein
MSERTTKHDCTGDGCRACLDALDAPSGTTGPADAPEGACSQHQTPDANCRRCVAGPADAGSHETTIAESGSQGERVPDEGHCQGALVTLPDSAITELRRAYERIHDLEQRLGLDKRRILAASASAPAAPRECSECDGRGQVLDAPAIGPGTYWTPCEDCGGTGLASAPAVPRETTKEEKADMSPGSTT